MIERTKYVDYDNGKNIKQLSFLVNKKMYDTCTCSGEMFIVLHSKTETKNGERVKTLRIKKMHNNRLPRFTI